MKNDENIRKYAFELTGDKFLENGKIQEALENYKKAGAQDKLKKLGHICLEKEYLSMALYAFRTAGGDLPKEKIMSLVEKGFTGNNIAGDIEVCQLFGELDKLIELGDFWFENNEFLKALEYYKAAGKKIPNEKISDDIRRKIIVEADRYFQDDIYPVRFVVDLYGLVGDKSKILSLLRTGGLIFRGEFKHCLEILENVAGTPLGDNLSKDGVDIILCTGDGLLAQGFLEEGRIVYDKLGIKVPKEKLILCGGKNLFGTPLEILLASPGVFKKGHKALCLAGLTPSKNKIEKAGDYYLGIGFVYYALQAYEKAEALSKLSELIEVQFQKNNISGAKETAVVLARVEEKIAKRK